MRPSRQGVLLVNLGSPATTAVADVSRYLREFLMDGRVIDRPYWQRWLIVHCLIAPFRATRTARAYQEIWLAEGSPLVVMSRRVRAALAACLQQPVALAMRYQHPSIESGVAELVEQGVQQLLLVPLFPHYALASYDTVVARVKGVLARQAPQIRLTVLPPFHKDPDYLAALVSSASEFLLGPYDHLLFSFHGVPERHLRKADPTGRYCLVADNCCLVPHLAHRTCYRAQVLQTVTDFVARAAIPAGKYSVAFQSRMGREPWLRPYTEMELVRLAECGCKRLLLICPSFVADCLETLEGIGIRGRAMFQQSGGRDITLIPCLNDQPQWIMALAKMIERAFAAAAP